MRLLYRNLGSAVVLGLLGALFVYEKRASTPTAAHTTAHADSASRTSRPNPPIEWTPVTGIDHQIFPSEQISRATSQTRLAFLCVKLLNVPAGTKIHATVKCESLIDESSADFVTAKDSPTLLLPIRTNWKFARLARIRQQIPENFIYSLTIDGQSMGERTDTAIIHSANDCILECRNDNGQWQDWATQFAAYVNEDHPKIDKLLKDTLATGVINDFDGYAGNNPKKVRLQVFAIWNELQLKGIKYSSITNVPDKSDFVVSQHVRFLDESIDNAQANCVDGSVLFASVLQKIGVESGLVVIPGHMFVVFFAEPGFKQPIALETTKLGIVDVARNSPHPLKDLLDPQWRTSKSAQSFQAAVEFGAEEYNALNTALNQKTVDHSDKYFGRIILISEARKAGIMPIPYEYTANPN